MVLWATLLVLHGATLAGSIPTGGSPENITVMFLSPSEVRVSWTTAVDTVEKYDVTYKPTDARVVVVVAGNSDSVTLTGLKPNTQYQVTVTAVREGRKFRSRPVVFRTLEMPKTPQETTVQITGGPPAKVLLPAVPPDPNMTPPYIQVRGVEVGIVCLVLLVWVGAIILFFNRWGKIRMLLPYQPDYKDTQLKVPGSCQQGNSCQNAGSSGLCCAQRYIRDDWGGRRLLMSRARINSAVYIGVEAEPLFPGGGRRTRSADQLVLPLLSVSTATDEKTTEQHL